MRILQQFKLLGVIFLALLVGGVYLTYGIFTQKFTAFDEVTLKTSSIGLQLPNRADVKIRGVIVGQVLSADADTDGAELTLGIFPDKIDIIPANVTGSIVPKTLFGEKYVSLVIPADASPDPIRTGGTIARTAVSTEVEQVLSDLYPLLRTVEPAQLNKTLNALATALEGRGDQLGQTIETTDAYLKRLNPEIPALVEDLRLTSQVSDIYSSVLPEVANIVKNTIKTTTTLRDRADKLNALFTDVTAFSDTTRVFLENNGDNLIRLGQVSEQQLAVLAKYAPEFPCLLSGLVKAGANQAEAFRNFTLHIVLETLPNQPRGYDPGDKPVFGDDRGPDCAGLPDPGFSQQNPLKDIPDFNDGVTRPTGKGTQRTSTGYSLNGAGFAGSTQERDLLNSLIAPGLGMSAEDVPDLGALLVGPMARGGTVTLGDQ